MHIAMHKGSPQSMYVVHVATYALGCSVMVLFTLVSQDAMTALNEELQQSHGAIGQLKTSMKDVSLKASSHYNDVTLR